MIIFYDINDLDFESFADYDIPYYCLLDMISVLGHLYGGIDKIFDCFKKTFLRIFLGAFRKNEIVSIHQRSLQTLTIEIYRAKSKISPEIANSLLHFTNKNCSLRNV